MSSKNIFLSADTVARWDSSRFENFWENNFSSMQLAPDGKIYITSTSSSKTFYIIDNPDIKGINCKVRKFGTLTAHFRGLPQYPNYRLGPLKGSPCDTLHVANKDITLDDFDIKLFPNPASTDIKIDITLKEYDPVIKTDVIIIDVSGAIVQKYTMPDFAYLATIDISKLASGVYGVQLRQPKRFGERVLATQKLVVLR
ncbi:MAG: T9SS type A sorting domain-containing protein [Saprospiraceae bacterium]|nr:T9SS type A sorting domain-containing protein [Saprospiraceae bacterium]